MDPNAALETIRRHAASAIDGVLDDDEKVEMAEAFEALDEWLTKGGFLPAAWANR